MHSPEVTCLYVAADAHVRENLPHFSRSIVALLFCHLLNVMAFELIDLPTGITLAKAIFTTLFSAVCLFVCLFVISYTEEFLP